MGEIHGAIPESSTMFSDFVFIKGEKADSGASESKWSQRSQSQSVGVSGVSRSHTEFTGIQTGFN